MQNPHEWLHRCIPPLEYKQQIEIESAIECGSMDHALLMRAILIEHLV